MYYFDHSATTPLHPKVKELMGDVGEFHFGNPSSVHASGQKAKTLIETARGQMAKAIGCNSNEVIFTGGGTEANNLVLWNLIHQKKKHVITSVIEHPAVLNVLDSLEEFGVTYSAVGVDKTGMVNPDDVQNALTEKTGLISIMLANNEMGTIQTISEIEAIAKKHDIIMHSDAVQTLGKIPVNAKELGVDCMSFSAHKFYGPKGVGVLFVRKGLKLKPLIIGGNQERRMRAGTENTPGIAGLGLAAELATKNLHNTQSHLDGLADTFKAQITHICPDVIFNGHPEKQLPGLINVSFPGFRNDLLMIHLDRQGIAVSSGSACSSGDIKPSLILSAMGIKDEINNSTLRISFGTGNSQQDVEYLTKCIKSTLERIRSAA
ncbi:MAG: cysteine desulfurase [Candidatus Marinimicrobia bacterium]|nr:cysteine desulfurase [Candidatus Neomarinimicrobiota bacterium]